MSGRLAALTTRVGDFPASSGTAPDPRASFEVASFRRNVDGGPVRFNPQPTGQFTVTNFALETLIRYAYQLQSYQLQAGPSWIREEHYDINARLDPQIAGRLQPAGHPPTWALALRNLLAERTTDVPPGAGVADLRTRHGSRGSQAGAQFEAGESGL